MEPAVAAVILNWNGREDTVRCLDSLRRSGHARLQLIVVDNGSTDGSGEVLAEQKDIVLISNEKNIGFTGGMNQGMEKGLALGADYLLLLNNDTVVAKDMLARLLEAHARHPEAGIIAPAVYHLDRPKCIQSMGGRINWHLGTCRLIGMDEEDRGQFGEAAEADYAHGCCMLLPKKALEPIGGYDNDYFAYWDEVDLAVRMREKGMGVLIVPAAKVYHRGYASAERTTKALPVYYMTRNRILFMRKHARTAHLMTFSYMLLRNTAGSALLYASMRQPDVLRALFRGLRDGLFYPLKR